MNTFVLFSSEHFYNIAGYFIVTLLALLLSSFSYKKRKLARISAIFIVFIKFTELLYRYFYFKEEILELLPLHLCNITLITAVLMMAFKSYFFFELTYFWAIGAIFAVITPEVRLMFPHFWNFSFFATHFYLLFAILFAIVHWGFKPTKESLVRAIISLNMLFIFIFAINLALGTNYMFVSYKPSFPSLLDHLGPWPLYIISLEFIGILLFSIAYLPFKKRKPKFSS